MKARRLGISGKRGPGRPTSRLGRILHDNLIVGRQEFARLKEDLAVVQGGIDDVRAHDAQLARIEQILVTLERRILTIENQSSAFRFYRGIKYED